MINTARSSLNDKIRCQILLKWLKIFRKSEYFKEKILNEDKECTSPLNSPSESPSFNDSTIDLSPSLLKRKQASKLMIDFLKRGDLYDEHSAANNNHCYLLNLIELVFFQYHFKDIIDTCIKNTKIIDDRLMDLCRRKVNELISIPSSYNMFTSENSNNLRALFMSEDQSTNEIFLSIFRRIILLFPTEFEDKFNHLFNGTIQGNDKNFQEILEQIHRTNIYTLCVNFYDLYPNDGLTLGSQNYAVFIMLSILFSQRHVNIVAKNDGSYFKSYADALIDQSMFVQFKPLAIGPGLFEAVLNVETFFDIVYPCCLPTDFDKDVVYDILDDIHSERVSLASHEESNNFPITINLSIVKNFKTSSKSNINEETEIDSNDDYNDRNESQPIFNIFKSIASKSIYRVVYTPTSIGTCIIDVLINEVPLKNSPWQFEIQAY